MSEKNNIETPSVEKLIPQQLVGNSTALIEFLKEYYRFLNSNTEPTNVINTIIQNKDLDDAVDKYVDMVRKELGYGISRNLEASKVNLYKHIGEFYRAKGSIESFKILFRLLFNKNVEISLPKEQILVASDGRWVQQNSLFAEVTSGDAFDLVNTFVNIINVDESGVKVEVERVRHYKENIYEIVVSRFFVGSINNNATFSSSGVEGTIINSLSGFTIEYPGKKFKVGQLLDVVYGQAIGTKIKVTSIDANGGITGLEFLSFGTNYPEEFTSQLVPVGFDYFFTFDPDTDTYTGSLNDQVSSSEYIYLEINPYCFGFHELQADGSQYAASDYFLETYSEGLEYVRISDDKYFAEAYLEGQRSIGNIDTKESSASLIQQDLTEADEATLSSLQSLYPNRAIVTFKNTPLSKYSGSYSTNKGFLSDDIYLQDNLYYQQFSYVIKTDEQFSTYEGLVKQAVHPAGMAVFGEFEITNEIDASGAILLLEKLFRNDFTDVIRTDEPRWDWVLEKPIEDELITSQFVYYEFFKVLEDEVLTPNLKSYELTKPISDENFAIDQIEDFTITKPLIDEVIIEDSSLFEDPALAYALEYFRQDYSEGLVYDTTNGFGWELTKPVQEIITPTETLFDFELNLGKADEIITLQSVEYNLTKPLTDIVDSQNEAYHFDINKPFTDTFKVFSTKFTDYDQEVYVLDSEPNEDDYFLDDYVEHVNIPIFDIELNKPFTETLTVSNADVYNPTLQKPFSENMITSETTFIFDIEKNILDDVAAAEDRLYTDPENTDIYVESPNNPDSDGAGGYFAGNYVEDINNPLLEFHITKPLENSINTSEGGLIAINPYATVHYFDGFFAEDYIEGSRAIS
jgi:hypothetical protein